MMKNLLALILLFISSVSFAGDITFEEAMALMDANAPTFNKIEVGERSQDESFEIHGECVLHHKTITTIVELTEKGATLFKDQAFDNNCTGEKWAKKFLVIDEMISWEKVKKQMILKLKDFPVSLLGTLIKFEKTVNGVRHTYHYDTKFTVFRNWIHHHHAYPGVEDHNTRNPLPMKIVLMSELTGLPWCQMDTFTHDIIGCVP